MPVPPRTYAGWAELMETFGQGDDTSLEFMAQGQWHPDAGTAIRFSQRVNDTYTARKKRWLTAYDRATTFQPLRSAADYAILLRQATNNLAPLYRFVGLAALPDNLRNTLRDDLTAFLDDIRQSLRDNIMRHPTERRDELLLALRAFGHVPNAINAATEAPNAASVATGRRIIF